MNPSERIKKHDAAYKELVQLGSAGVPSLIPLLKEQDMYFAESTAVLLGAIGPAAKSAVPEIVKLARAQERCLWRAPMERKEGPDALGALKRILLDRTERNAALAKVFELEDPIKEIRDVIEYPFEKTLPEYYTGTSVCVDINNDGLEDIAILTNGSRGMHGGMNALFLKQKKGNYRYVGDFFSYPGYFLITPKTKGTIILESYSHSSATTGEFFTYEISPSGIKDLGTQKANMEVAADKQKCDAMAATEHKCKVSRFGSNKGAW